jgi:hypothetical protein
MSAFFIKVPLSSPHVIVDQRDGDHRDRDKHQSDANVEQGADSDG